MGVGLLVGLWIARYLGPDKFGQISFAKSLVALFSAIAALGLRSIVVRDIVRNPESTDETLGTAFLMQFISGFISYWLILIAIDYLRPGDTVMQTIVAVLGSIMFLRASNDIAEYWFESQVQSKYTVWVQNILCLLFAGIKTILIFHQAPLIAFVSAISLEVAVGAVLMPIIMNHFGPSLFKLRFSTFRAKTLLRDSWPLIFSAIAIVTYSKIDQVMLGQMDGNEAVGIYSAAAQISETWYFIIPIVLSSLFPTLANLYVKNKDLLTLRWVQAYAFMFWLSIFSALVISFFSDGIVNMLFGKLYSGAALVLSIHIWSGINVALGSVWSIWLLLENKLQIGLYGHLFGAAINVMLNLWLIPLYGPLGAAYATMIGYFLSAIIAYSLHKPSETFKLIGRAILLKGIL